MPQPKIAFLIPSTSKNRDFKTLSDSYLFKFSQPSISSTCSTHEYKIFLGIDGDDELYNQNTGALSAFDVTTFDCSYKGHLTRIWNVLFKKAYEQGYDYFVQCGDDIEFHKGWIHQCLAVLKEYNDVGVVGPRDTNNPKLLTQTMVSKKHMEVFGYYFPEEIKNWYCDDWINEVYRYCNRNFMCGTCENKGGKERYDIQEVDKKDLYALVNRDFKKLNIPDVKPIIGLVISTFNRPQYVHQTFASLYASELNQGDMPYEVHVVIVDDCSTEERTKKLVDELSLGNTKSLNKFFKQVNHGIFNSLKDGWDYLVRKGCNVLTNIDADVLVDETFLTKSIGLYKKYRPKILTGYNSCKHKPLTEYNDVLVKNSCGGVNMLFSVNTYINTIRSCLVSVTFDNVIGYIFKGDIICARPSLIQHIGLNGMNNRGNLDVDISYDFGSVINKKEEPSNLIENRTVTSSILQQKHPQTIYIDTTFIYKVNPRSYTGIQRVVKQLSSCIYKALPSVEFIRFDNGAPCTNNRFKKILSNTYIQQGETKDSKIEFKTGDILFLLDENFSYIHHAAGNIKALRDAGLTVVSLLHDVIPMTHPQYFSDSHSKMFGEWLDVISDISSGIICVSETTKSELLRLKPSLKVKSFHLGNNNISEHGGKHIIALPTGKNVLMVGTIEPRKCHSETLTAFEKLWETRKDINLIIAGRHGWLTDKLVERIRSHPLLDKNLFWLNDTSDSDLIYLYKNADLFLFSSDTEGFGIPLIEAASYNLSLLLRDKPVFREIAGNNAVYFSDFDDLVIKLSDNDISYPESKNTTMNSWSDSALDVIKHLMRFRLENLNLV